MPVPVALVIAGAALGLVMAVSSFIPPVNRFLVYNLNKIFPNANPEVEALIRAKIRNEIDLPTYYEKMSEYGYNRETADLMLKISLNLPTLSELIELRRREVITEDEFYNYTSKLGFESHDAKLIYNLSKRLLDFTDLVVLYWRKEIDANTFYTYANRLGYDVETANLMLKRLEYFPSPSDLIRFAVREVYTPEVVTKFRMMEDLPQKFLEEARKAGLTEEQAKNYWAAHWELPSITMGFEMFHRGIITREELELLLRTLDVMPFWRDKLIELSYTVPTRVDVRRMYHMGVVDRNYVYRTYQKLGYSPEDAEVLTRWTELSAVEEERTLTKTQVLELYEAGDFDKQTALKYLQLLGYSAEAAEFLIKLRDHEIANREQKETIELLMSQFEAGIITQEQLFDELARLGLKDTKLRKIQLQAQLKRKKAVKLPSLSDVKRWYIGGIISEDAFYEYLKLLNVREDDIIRYKAECDLEVLERLRKKEKPPKLPTVATISQWYLLKIIDREEFIDYMRKHGWVETDIQHLLEQLDLETLTKVKKGEKLAKIPSPTTLSRWLLLGIIDEETFYSYMLEAGYEEDVIEKYLVETYLKMKGEE